MDKPLIVTAELSGDAFAFLNQKRQRYFPADRNFLDAHLTLFHHLPPEEEASIQETLLQISQQTSPIPGELQPPFLLGRGVAYRIIAPELLPLHNHLQALWSAWLTAQDRQPLRPHVTVQNKVAAEEAKALLKELTLSYTSMALYLTGLSLYRYTGGPWEPVASFPFQL